LNSTLNICRNSNSIRAVAKRMEASSTLFFVSVYRVAKTYTATASEATAGLVAWHSTSAYSGKQCLHATCCLCA
jgi:hypothetical protein